MVFGPHTHHKDICTRNRESHFMKATQTFIGFQYKFGVPPTSENDNAPKLNLNVGNARNGNADWFNFIAAMLHKDWTREASGSQMGPNPTIAWHMKMAWHLICVCVLAWATLRIAETNPAFEMLAVVQINRDWTWAAHSFVDSLLHGFGLHGFCLHRLLHCFHWCRGSRTSNLLHGLLHCTRIEGGKQMVTNEQTAAKSLIKQTKK